MSRFNSYAKRLDEMAKAALNEHKAKAEAYKAAMDKESSFPKNMKGILPKYAADHAVARQKMLEARDEYQNSKKHLEEVRRELLGLRKELAADIDAAYSADPTKIDANVLELLRSGILTPREYNKLIDDAHAAENPTLARVIGRYADEAAQVADNNNDRTKANELRVAARKARANNGSSSLDTFDSLISLYDRCTTSGSLISKWDEIAGEAIDNF